MAPSFSDPRTGEIVRTVVRIDAWRSLIDYNIYAGLLPAAGPNGLSVSAQDFAMARRRQHAAHEIGHTLGFPHNYIASSQGRTSVMDYPFPLITINAKNEIDLTQAFAPGAARGIRSPCATVTRGFPMRRPRRRGSTQSFRTDSRRGFALSRINIQMPTDRSPTPPAGLKAARRSTHWSAPRKCVDC